MIKIKELWKKYHIGEVDITALKGIDLTISRGEFISIMGSSGSGKSTLLHILGGLDLPTSGNYLLEDIDITTLDDKELSRIRNEHFGFIFQSYNLFPELTAVENVIVPLMYAKADRKKRLNKAIDLLESVGLGQRINHYPGQLSGGEQQRVAVARALANDPTLILADEPTGNLASHQGKEIMNILKRLHRERKTTIVMVTHDPGVAIYGKRLVGIRDGEILMDRPIKDGEKSIDMTELMTGVI